MKLITRVSKRDDDPILQLEPHIFTLQRVPSQRLRLCCLAEPTFQRPMQHPEQLEAWLDRESIPPSPETPALPPGTAQALVLPTSTPSPSAARMTKGRSSSAARGMGRCIWHTGLCQEQRAHPKSPSCPDTSSSLPPARGPAALWLTLGSPAWTSCWN